MLNTKYGSGVYRQTLLPIIRRCAVIIFAALLLTQAPPALATDSDASPQAKNTTPASYTSFKRFPQNLGRNFLALFSNKNIVPLLIGGAATGHRLAVLVPQCLNTHPRKLRPEPGAIMTLTHRGVELHDQLMIMAPNHIFEESGGGLITVSVIGPRGLR